MPAGTSATPRRPPERSITGWGEMGRRTIGAWGENVHPRAPGPKSRRRIAKDGFIPRSGVAGCYWQQAEGSVVKVACRTALPHSQKSREALPVTMPASRSTLFKVREPS